MDERLPGGPRPPAAEQPAPSISAAGDRGAAEAERQAAADSAAMPSGEPAPAPATAQTAQDDGDLDTAFSPTLPQEAARFGEPAPVAPICQWCNARLPSADVPKCPTCGVRLQPVEATPEVPGQVPMTASPVPAQPVPTARPPVPAGAMPRDPAAYEGLTADEIQLLSNSSAALRQEITQLNSREALEPPTRDVRQAMLEIEFEADRADPMRIVDPGPLSDRRTLEPPV
jgi:hypothetical protein